MRGFEIHIRKNKIDAHAVEFFKCSHEICARFWKAVKYRNNINGKSMSEKIGHHVRRICYFSILAVPWNVWILALCSCVCVSVRVFLQKYATGNVFPKMLFFLYKNNRVQNTMAFVASTAIAFFSDCYSFVWEKQRKEERYSEQERESTYPRCYHHSILNKNIYFLSDYFIDLLKMGVKGVCD